VAPANIRTKFAALNKRGTSLPLKALVYVILTAILVILAAAFLIDLWSTFVSADDTKQDMQLLAQRIEDLTKSDEEYAQEVMFLQTADNFIVGFDKYDQSISIGPLDREALKNYKAENSNCHSVECVAQDRFTIQRPEACTEGTACLCKVTKDKVDPCVTLDVDSVDDFLLASDYEGHLVWINDKKDGLVGIPSQIQMGPYKKFAMSALMWRSVDTLVYSSPYGANVQIEETRTHSIIPVIIEKQVFDGKTIITVMPSNQQNRMRYFTAQKCPVVKDDPCSGLTPEISYTRFGDSRYCALSTIGDVSCSVRTMPYCLSGGEQTKVVTSPCICSDTTGSFVPGGVMIRGVCDRTQTEQMGYVLRCENINTCHDYCKIGTGVTSLNEQCMGYEQILCQNDPCKITRCDFTTAQSMPDGSTGNDCI
jgi:hypothetical protein